MIQKGKLLVYGLLVEARVKAKATVLPLAAIYLSLQGGYAFILGPVFKST